MIITLASHLTTLELAVGGHLYIRRQFRQSYIRNIERRRQGLQGDAASLPLESSPRMTLAITHKILAPLVAALLLASPVIARQASSTAQRDHRRGTCSRHGGVAS